MSYFCTMNQKIEKALLLEITSWQFEKRYNLSEMLELLESFNESEKDLYHLLKNEASAIFNFIYSPFELNIVHNEGVDSIFDYNNKIGKVNEELLKFCNDFEISLKRDPISKDYKSLIIKLLGIEFYNRAYGSK